MIIHFAWLGKWYLYPITMLIMSPNLYWHLRHLVQGAYTETLESIKLFYEMLAAQMGCGLSLGAGIELVVSEMEREQKMAVSLKKPLRQIAVEVTIGLFDIDSFEPINQLSQVPMMNKFNEMLIIGLRTGSPIDQLLIHFADMLSDLLKHKREFKRRLNQKRSEFHIMMLMPVGAIIGIRELLGSFFNVLYETNQGLLLLFVVTILYSVSCYLFYHNDNRVLAEDV